MANNKTYEPDYSNGVNFNELKAYDQTFRKLLAPSNGLMNWKDAAHLRHLTTLLLKKDFDLEIKLPDDRLCPPIPVRLAYIQWIHQLVESTKLNSSRRIAGLDIGVGSSCIYPLLGQRTRPDWLFIGTELDEKNFQYATQNVEVNELETRIKLIKVGDPEQVLPSPQDLKNMKIPGLDFTMCNPPFYCSQEDMSKTWDKTTPPSAICTGAPIEMICAGGDEGFVLRLLSQSQQPAYRRNVRWFTTMVGKYSSARTLVDALKAAGCKNWAVGTLAPGTKTRRWVVGWSWLDVRPDERTARGEELPKELLPPATEWGFRVSDDTQAAGKKMNSVLGKLDVRWKWREENGIGRLWAEKNVWSRAARREQERKDQKANDDNDDEDMDVDSEDEDDYALVVEISIGDRTVNIRWLKGDDYGLFESFCGMLKRQITQ
jgi:23S rRNA (adenine1618-N6)-methyltransferase